MEQCQLAQGNNWEIDGWIPSSVGALNYHSYTVGGPVFQLEQGPNPLVAQWLERYPYKVWVGGSSPPKRTYFQILIKYLERMVYDDKHISLRKVIKLLLYNIIDLIRV